VSATGPSHGSVYCELSPRTPTRRPSSAAGGCSLPSPVASPKSRPSALTFAYAASLQRAPSPEAVLAGYSGALCLRGVAARMHERLPSWRSAAACEPRRGRHRGIAAVEGARSCRHDATAARPASRSAVVGAAHTAERLPVGAAGTRRRRRRSDSATPRPVAAHAPAVRETTHRRRAGGRAGGRCNGGEAARARC
jgi:hypothetical protein